MNPSLHLFVVVVVSTMAFLCAGQTCTPQTCPPGPVTVTFQYPNCTGARFYESIAHFVTPCRQESAQFWSTTMADDYGIFQVTGINNPKCDLTLSNATFIRNGLLFGVCIPGSAARDFARIDLGRDASAALDADTMYLSSVNATFDAPQVPQVPGNPKNLTEINTVMALQACTGPYNCTTEAGKTPTIVYSSFLEAGNCSTAITSTYRDPTIGACYYEELTGMYVSLHCLGDHGYDFTKYFDDSCSKPIQLQSIRETCTSFAGTKNIICTSPFTPVSLPPPPPSSSASVLSSAPLAIAFFFLLALQF